MPPNELRMLVVAVSRSSFGAKRHALVDAVARTLLFNRTGGKIAEVLDKIIQGLLDEGQLVENLEMILPSE